MTGVNGDRRKRRTKKLLMKSLTSLMREKKINKITVTELTELADINRSTFYLNYKDIHDMIEQIETEMFDEFNQQLEKLYICDPSRENTLSFFMFVFEFVKDNADICKVLLGQDGDYTFLNKFKVAIMESQPPIVHKLDKTCSRYFMPFAVAGCIGAIQQWLQDDMETSPRDISEFIISLITNGLKYYNIEV
jgi:AcrR family transcriptional regulator